MTTARAPRTYPVKVYARNNILPHWIGGCRGCGGVVVVALGEAFTCACGDTTTYSVAEKPKKDGR